MELNWVLISSLKALWRFAVSAATNPPGVMLTPLNRMVSGPLSSWPCPAVATAALPDDAPLLLRCSPRRCWTQGLPRRSSRQTWSSLLPPTSPPPRWLSRSLRSPSSLPRRPLPALLRSGGRVWPILLSTSGAAPVALAAPGATLPSLRQSLRWFSPELASQQYRSWLAANWHPLVRLLACLSVSQQTLFPNSGTATVLVLQVFSLPLSSLSKEISDRTLGIPNTPVQKVEADSYGYINY